MTTTDENLSANSSFFKRKSSSILNQIANLKGSLTVDYLSDLDEASVTVRLELLDRLLKNFEEVQDGLEHENLDEIYSDARANFSSNYAEVKTALTRQLRSLHPDTPRPSSTARQFSLDEPQQSIIVTQPRSRLPLLVIPEFSGDSKEWPNFYSMFQSVVGNESDLTKTEKFQHLLSRLRKPASDTVSLLDINDANYDIALEMLKTRYDNKRLNFQAHIRGIFALHNVQTGDVSKLRELSDKVNAHIRALQTMGTKEQLADCLLIHLIGHKLDVASQTKWEEQTAVNTIPSWKSMAAFLEKRCQMLENVEYAVVINTPSKEVSKKSVQNISNSRGIFVASSSSDSANACVVCHLYDHAIQNCPQFAALSPALRYSEAKRMRLCLNCLKRGHMVKDCKSGYCRHCQLKHNSLLHLHSVSSPSNIEPINQSSQSSSSLISTSYSGAQPESCQLAKNCVFIATAVVLVKNLAGSMIPCRAILDSASQLNCITNRLANQLGLRRTKSTTIISGIGESNLVSNETAEIVMESRLGSFTTSFNATIVPTITDNQPTSTIANVDWNIPSNIALADPHFFRSQRIDILIGAGLFFELMCVGQIRLKGNLPLLQKTRLGWIVSGGGTHNLSDRQKSSVLTVVQNVSTDNIADICLHDLVSRFWEVEDCNFTASKNSKEELECERHFVENHIRLKTGQYSVQLPTRMCPSKLGESYQQALRRFMNLEKRLQTRPEINRQYSEFMKEYAELKHMSEVKSFPPGTSNYFLPHHCVLKEDSTTTKLRVVFDGSAVSSSGYSLNDILHVGPTIQPKLFNILLRFRSFKIALTADICKMYRCVLVSLPDSYLQCILWRDNPKDPIRIYKLETVTYGTKPAAFLSIRAMHQLAADEEKTYPIGAKVVRRDFYVDDMISGGNSEEEVVEIMKQTTSLLGSGHFKLRKWCSNDSKVLAEVPEADREQYLKFHDGSDITKTLGLVWDPSSDNFLFSSIPFSNTNNITKRTVLKFVARFYDPLGLIGPIITKAKIFLQLLWKEKLEWDESLPQWLQSAWLRLSVEFQLVDSFTFSRFIFHNNTYLELHAFCDASLAAYGVCIYVRAKCNGITKTHLLCSKSRVAPLKTISVPKLELSAAMLLAEFMSSIRGMNIVRGEFFCWTDSTVVLSWLRQEPSNYAVFVANRVSKIQALTKDMTWCYVPSLFNPADILSKGATPRELQKSSLWKYGPAFLESSRTEWPIYPTPVVDLPERRKRILLSIVKPLDLTINCKFVNSFWTMQKIYAYVYKYFRVKCRIQNEVDIARVSPGYLTVKDIQQGTYMLLRMIQRTNLTNEYKALAAKKMVSSSSSIYSLNPFLGADGLLRVGGRLSNSSMDFESKHPIILPKHHPLTDAIITYFHRKFLHAGPQSLLASLRLQYWPIGGRKEVTRVVNKCIRCFHLKPRYVEKIMGDLPQDRVQSNRAFLTTGVDYCGPFYYQSEVRGRLPTKCYISLFICFSTKAIHLEVVKDMSTPAFLAALKRFICTRGRPKCIWSDNATNFVESPDDLEVLTPAHFLVGAPFTSIVEPDVTMLNINRLSRWQRVCYMQQVFWKKWNTEYLTTLQQRNKWRSSTAKLKVGDMVLLKDENLPPLKWPLARITELIKGDDDVARIAVLRTNGGTTRRAVTKLCILPIEQDPVESLEVSTGGVCSDHSE